MKYVLDTCVISELSRPEPEPRVVKWVGEQNEAHLFLSVLTLGELRKGISRLSTGRKRTHLESWLDRDLATRFIGRWLPMDEEVADRWGIITAECERRGHALPVIDGIIAATALVHGMSVVTRNVADIQSTGVPVLNPWVSLKA